MKTLLLAINSKYIHPNLAVRLLSENTAFSVDIKEFTIKDAPENIIGFVNDYKPDVLGVSCYIWNIEIVREILPKFSSKTIILGGPEVSYNPEFYLENGLADYVIKNEGEEAFDRLLGCINGASGIESVPNLYYLKNGVTTFTFDKNVDVSELRPAYDAYDDVSHKISYIETSRGCPYKCGYCMASLDNNLRFFDIEQIKEEILKLKKRGAKTFKFLDRTFNANKKFLELLAFIIENHEVGESYQFEITGDVLREEYIDYINENAPPDLIRFEIGIQSTNEASNIAVYRRQDNAKLFKNIRRIQNGGVIDLHLDLICGLPLETYDIFKKTFEDCLALRPKELQLGFLKLLKGTALYRSRYEHGYKFSENAPYEIVCNDYMSEEDIHNIHVAENAFDHFYNKGIFRGAMNVILDNETEYLEFFRLLGTLNVSGNLEERFRALDDFVSGRSYYYDLHKALILDYLNYFKIKPRAWWKERPETKRRKELFRNLSEKDTSINIDDCLRHGMLIELEYDIIIGVWTKDLHYVKTFDTKQC